MKRCHGCNRPMPTTKTTIKSIWRYWNIKVPLMDRRLWRTMLILQTNGPLTLEEINEHYQPQTERTLLPDLAKRLVDDGLFELDGTTYSLSAKGRGMFEFGPAGSIVQNTANYYLRHGMCVQDAGNHGLIVDGYNQDPPMLVNVFPKDASAADIERIRANILEAYALDFLAIHLWAHDDGLIDDMCRMLPKTVRGCLLTRLYD